MIKDVAGNIETTETEADGSTSTTKTYTDGRTTVNEVRSNGVTIDIENDGRNKTTIARDAEGYVLEMKQYKNEDPEITLVDSLGEAVEAETAKTVIRRMDLNIKVEDIDNLKLPPPPPEENITEDTTAEDTAANTENTVNDNNTADTGNTDANNNTADTGSTASDNNTADTGNTVNDNTAPNTAE